MFNNQIYGLTKGQYSPTSEVAKVTKSTPFGSVDTPFNPVSLALGRRGHLRGPDPRHGPRPHAGDLPPGPRAQRRRLRRGPAELQRLQRRRLREDHQPRRPGQHADPAPARPADRLRGRGRGARRDPAGRRQPRDRVGGRSGARTPSWCTTRTATTPASPSRCPGWPAAPTSRPRSASSAPSSGPSTGPRWPSRSPRPRASAGWATWRRCSAPARAGPSTDDRRRPHPAG